MALGATTLRRVSAAILLAGSGSLPVQIQMTPRTPKTPQALNVLTSFNRLRKLGRKVRLLLGQLSQKLGPLPSWIAPYKEDGRKVRPRKFKSALGEDPHASEEEHALEVEEVEDDKDVE
ncbi:hypothetical protein BD309DRAFT_1024273 [Dichomitus squalens]|uniref:Uncharacterized protein n=1 Tax=Dichomitus squalens TaxID=114155 RepID=A0A4Q9P979_9APHY|nr:hypothetical protein BD309DRAFT_1024273 [Dichomitus squalens]TBU51124.1 hypothetical protein BD310DRAFT_982916 [Dichomitus squalens]